MEPFRHAVPLTSDLPPDARYCAFSLIPVRKNMTIHVCVDHRTGARDITGRWFKEDRVSVHVLPTEEPLVPAVIQLMTTRLHLMRERGQRLTGAEPVDQHGCRIVPRFCVDSFLNEGLYEATMRLHLRSPDSTPDESGCSSYSSDD